MALTPAQQAENDRINQAMLATQAAKRNANPNKLQSGYNVV